MTGVNPNKPEIRLILEVPKLVVLGDGTTVQVKGVAARVIDGRVEQVIYTIEKSSGAWADVAGPDVRPAPDDAAAPAATL